MDAMLAQMWFPTTRVVPRMDPGQLPARSRKETDYFEGKG
jgi:hypothetical protein